MKGNILFVFLLTLALAAGALYLIDYRRPSAAPAAEQTEPVAAAVTAGKPDSPGTGDALLEPSSLWAQSGSSGQASGGNRLDSLARNLESGRSTAIVTASAMVAPCVVSVNVLQTQVVRQAYRDWFGYFYAPRQRTVQGIGSGFIINSRGYILTNNHVVEDGTKITVSTNDGAEYPAEVVGTDPSSDVALLKIDPRGEKLSVARLGDSDDLLLGEWVIAIGSPFGLLLDDPQPTVTAGVISAIGRDIVRDQDSDKQVYANMIQTDAAINPGNSGGPLANALGEVIGINTFIFSPSGGSVGMGFAIPINRAVRIAEDLIRGGKVRHPWLGIKVQALTPDLLRGLGFGSGQRLSGVVVSNILNYSPAEQSGRLRSGDLITAINGRNIRSVDDWTGEQLDIRVGTPVQIRAHRPGRDFTVEITPVELPTETLPHVDTGLGFELVDLTREVRSQLEARSSHGAVVEDITDSDLESAGSLLRYDILYRINDTDITSAAQAVDMLKSSRRSRGDVLFLERDGRAIRRYVTH